MDYSNIYIDGPLDKYVADWDYFDNALVKQFFAFKDVGDNVVGIRMIEREKVAEYGQTAQPVSLPAVRKNYELGPNGVVEVPRIPFSAHVTRAGTPHRTQHAFGYWHINDKDEIIIPLPPEGDTPPRIIIIMGKPAGDGSDRFAWYCEKCLTLLFMRESDDFDKFWAAELDAVRAYNADPQHQICPSCGHQNPLGYSGMQSSDSPEERAARFVW
ncbi:hypothetical protein [Pusillimonas sp.]|uniref:hypothetical protein n=1 Tax=Pusillimonas sp. TaxID=3040095 RepID=UPI0029BA139B|nr:hypothetical protein [Pusillimonas sp.]MDX3893432.1 hypothetical protein [Pusillimonas sp.]